jgi:hypothetical protein
MSLSDWHVETQNISPLMSLSGERYAALSSLEFMVGVRRFALFLQFASESRHHEDQDTGDQRDDGSEHEVEMEIHGYPLRSRLAVKAAGAFDDRIARRPWIARLRQACSRRCQPLWPTAVWVWVRESP